MEIAIFPENTFEAFESAVKMGVDIIETDVHLTKRPHNYWHDLHWSATQMEKGELKTLLWQN